MNWEKIEFGKLYLTPSQNGLNRPSSVRGEGYKMINMGELFANDRIKDIPMELVSMSDREIENYSIHINDLLFARQSMVLSGAGKCSIVIEVPEITTFESHIIRVRLNQEKADPLFYYYYFKSPLSSMSLIVQQGVQAGIRASDLKDLQVIFPPLLIQRRFAEILRRYDTLIENYQRQIGILEASAQMLYREWFMRGRCPYAKYDGDEKLPIGWERVKFTDVISIQSGGTPKTDNPQFWDGDIFWLSPADLENSFYVLSTEKTITDLGLRNCNSKLYPPNTVIITARGTVGRCVLLGTPMAINQSNYALIGKTVSQYFVFFKSLELADKWKKEAIGAVFETITVNNFERTEIVLPTPEVLELFDKIIKPILNKIRNSLQQIELLRQMRDKLLPRLMSGKIPLAAAE
ncbi:MAG TPA: restriction endonuclease subunit S [Pyrinomonadaceae bacterium]|nr:restriction endonuclease subunit S [Pyrinomonadaceae bacterium]